MYLFGEIFKAVHIYGILWLCLLSWPLDRFDRFAIWSILHTILAVGVSSSILSISLSLLGLFGVVVFLEILFSHFPLNDHQTGIDKGLLEKLTLEHPNQVFDADVLARRSFDNAAIGLYLLLLRQRLLRIGLTLLSKSGLVLLEEFRGLFKSILRIFAVDALIIEFCR